MNNVGTRTSVRISPNLRGTRSMSGLFSSAEASKTYVQFSRWMRSTVQCGSVSLAIATISRSAEASFGSCSPSTPASIRGEFNSFTARMGNRRSRMDGDSSSTSPTQATELLWHSLEIWTSGSTWRRWSATDRQGCREALLLTTRSPGPVRPSRVRAGRRLPPMLDAQGGIHQGTRRRA